jgi:hypothetical protein
MRPLAVALLCALIGGGAYAKDAEDCIAAAGAAAAAIAKKHLGIAVIGSASSELTGPSGTNIAYPTRLQAALTSLLPGVAVKVTTYARPRETAEEMQKKLSRIVNEAKPALVVWQTGTADAIRGVDAEDFRVALDDGIATLQQAGVDIVLMNMHLFDRFSIMRKWNEAGTFDLYAATRKTDVAEHVHDCLGRLLANAVLEAAKLTNVDKKETR